MIGNYTGSRLQRKKDAKEPAFFKWVLVLNELFNIAVNYFEAKKAACCSRTRCKRVPVYRRNAALCLFIWQMNLV